MIRSTEEFVRLRTSSDPLEYHRAAHDEAPEAVWLEIVHGHPEMKEWVAHNKTVPPPIFRLLSQDLDPKVRMAVATVRRAGDDILRLLAADPNSSVRRAVAFNAKAPRDVVEKLARDGCGHVAEGAAARLRRTASK